MKPTKNKKQRKFNFERRLKKVPLRVRLYVSTHMAFINLITELGYRENKSWSDEEDELLNKLTNCAKEQAQSLLKEIKEWEKDGRPGRIKANKKNKK